MTQQPTEPTDYSQAFGRLPWLTVAHRGFPQYFPENSLTGVLAACDLGVGAVEFDVQVSQDGELVVFHDETLDRVTDRTGKVSDLTLAQLKEVHCAEPQRLGSKFSQEKIVSLHTMCTALRAREQAVFIELKRQVMHTISRQQALESLLKASDCLGDRRRIISFDYDFVALAKAANCAPVGWVIRQNDELTRERAEHLQPDFLICKTGLFDNPMALWSGSWQWFVYDITDARTAWDWYRGGAALIESWNPPALTEEVYHEFDSAR